MSGIVSLRRLLPRLLCIALALSGLGLVPAAVAFAADAASATAATPLARGVPNAATTASAAPSSSAATSSSASAPQAASTVPAASSPVSAAKPPTPTSSPTAAASPSYQSSPQIRYGDSAVFRNLIPSQVLENQAAEEFEQIVHGADHANRLYPNNDVRVQRVRDIANRLIPYSLKWNERAKNWKWEVAVVQSPDIRMYCLPGGKIVVYSGLLDRVRLNNNELGMLIGHEIAHALREHARERLGEQQAAQFTSGSIPQLFGLADLGAAPLGIGSQLLEMKYGRADETEADVMGSEIASRAGYDPRAAVTLWDKLAAATHSNRNGGYIYVHPYSATRRQDIIKRLPDMLPLYAKALGKDVDGSPGYAATDRSRQAAARK
ncbi:M48 family metallopeptidase [Paraburkholderia megapolitana]|uniref:Peptidase family M48 n=1 Tax=Paraburkholderia megapolitana TaxID=420953 RepID=A0A1I3UW47_9BURK|nr:Peptidase family M48 [Paraburkholderia megapolitana]